MLLIHVLEISMVIIQIPKHSRGPLIPSPQPESSQQRPHEAAVSSANATMIGAIRGFLTHHLSFTVHNNPFKIRTHHCREAARVAAISQQICAGRESRSAISRHTSALPPVPSVFAWPKVLQLNNDG